MNTIYIIYIIAIICLQWIYDAEPNTYFIITFEGSYPRTQKHPVIHSMCNQNIL